MKVSNEQNPIPPSDWANKRPRKASARQETSAPVTDSAELSAKRADQAPKSQDTVHREAALRESVAKLIESGDLSAAEEGDVRRQRVDEARKKLETGAYRGNDVIGGIVDRLLDQWKI
ncbi:MAG: hypothetical protein HZB43_09995 [candidate division Zixibacteria bacterium]|nr:hypothetical protein [candidate division Zixibacteria bacterium]